MLAALDRSEADLAAVFLPDRYRRRAGANLTVRGSGGVLTQGITIRRPVARVLDIDKQRGAVRRSEDTGHLAAIRADGEALEMALVAGIDDRAGTTGVADSHSPHPAK